WTSTNPGVTSNPSASICRWPGPRSAPTAVIVSPSIATSADVPGAPEPSTTNPRRITRSCITSRYPDAPIQPSRCEGPIDLVAGSSSPGVEVDDREHLAVGLGDGQRPVVVELERPSALVDDVVVPTARGQQVGEVGS